MIKSIALLTLSATVLLAFDAKVSRGDVIVSINELNQTHAKDASFRLQGGDVICFLEGKGVVTITAEQYKKRLSKRSKSCKVLPTKDKSGKNYLAAIGKNIAAKFSNATESSVAGVSTRALDSNTPIKTALVLDPQTPYLLLSSESWSPLPIHVTIQDSNGSIVAQESNEEETTTAFIFPTKLFKSGYTIHITNGFDELLMESNVTLKN